MNWAEEVASTYRDVGTAESIAFAYNGSSTTYADCQVVPRSDTRVVDAGGGKATRAVVHFLEIHVPRLQSTAPAERSSFTWGGKVYVTGPASALHGVWRIEAS